MLMIGSMSNEEVTDEEEQKIRVFNFILVLKWLTICHYVE
jgi:hypothetical protein